nr:hypothetical protein HUO10_005933 [Paraburkholderia busanensis]
MSISVNSINAASNLAVTPLAPDTSLSGAALAQSTGDATLASSPVTVAPLDPQQTSARLAQYLKALDAPLVMGADAQNILNALVPTMQSIVAQRPDLANAQFDFQSSNGSIQVISSTLSASDKSWIQAKLNGNSALVQSVQSFHDDAVAGYATWADADGSPLTQEQSNAVSKQADGLVSFLNLFQSLGNAAQQSLMKDGTYKAPDGTTANLAQNPTSAAGFLQFANSAQAFANGTVSFISNSGHNAYGNKLNIFDNDTVMPNFFPSSQTTSLGVDEVA